MWIPGDTLSESFQLFAFRQNAATMTAHEMSIVSMRAISARHHVNAIVSTFIVLTPTGRDCMSTTFLHTAPLSVDLWSLIRTS